MDKQPAALPAPRGNPQEVVRVENLGLSFYDRFSEPLVAISQLGLLIAQARLFGEISEQQGKVLAWHLLVSKKDPFELMRQYHIMSDGKLSRRADAMSAEFLQKGGKIHWISKLMDKKSAKATFIDYDGIEYLEEITFEECAPYAFKWDREAKERVLKDNWKNSPADMLRARLVSKVIRMIDPAINVGLYTPEELQDGFGDADPDNHTPPALFGRKGPPGLNETVAEVIDIKSAAEVASGSSVPEKAPAAAPVEQAPPLAAAEPTQVHAPATPESRMEELKKKLSVFPETAVSGMYAVRKWLKSGEGYLSLPDDRVKWILANWTMEEKTIRIYLKRHENDGGSK